MSGQPKAFASAADLSQWDWVSGDMAEFVPDIRVAFHEAGHLVMEVLFGTPVGLIFASSAGGGVFRQGPFLGIDDLVVLLAGQLAEGFWQNHQHRRSDEELAVWLDRASRGIRDHHDCVKVFRFLIERHGHQMLEVMAAYRKAEDDTIKILSRDDVRAAIRAVANELVNVGRLSGAHATEIASRHIEPGSLKMEKSE